MFPMRKIWFESGAKVLYITDMEIIGCYLKNANNITDMDIIKDSGACRSNYSRYGNNYSDKSSWFQI